MPDWGERWLLMLKSGTTILGLSPRGCLIREPTRALGRAWTRIVYSMDWLCEDLLLLAIDCGRGSLGRVYGIGYGLMGAELVRLAASGRIDIADDRIVVTNGAPTGDAEL